MSKNDRSTKIIVSTGDAVTSNPRLQATIALSELIDLMAQKARVNGWEWSKADTEYVLRTLLDDVKTRKAVEVQS